MKIERYISIINWIADQSGNDVHEVLNDFIQHENMDHWQVAALCEHYMADEYIPIFLRKQAS